MIINNHGGERIVEDSQSVSSDVAKLSVERISTKNKLKNGANGHVKEGASSLPVPTALEPRRLPLSNGRGMFAQGFRRR